MQSGFQRLLYNDLNRRVCSVIIAQQFAIQFQCTAIIREKSESINTVSRYFQIAGQHKADITFHFFGNGNRFYDIFSIHGSCINIFTKIAAEFMPYSFQSGIQRSPGHYRFCIRSFDIPSTCYIRRRTVGTEGTESKICRFRHFQIAFVKSRLLRRHAAVRSIANFNAG